MKPNYTATKITCYIGYIVQAIINNFLPILFIALHTEYNLGYEELARLILVNFATQIFSDLITPKIVKVLSYKKVAILSQMTAAIGLALLGVLPNIIPPYTGILISIVIYAFGSGLMEVIMSPIIEMLPTKNKAGNMSVLHSFYCWGQAFTVIVTTALVMVFGYSKWMNIPMLWSVIPFINMFAFMGVPVVEPNPELKQWGLIKLIKTPRFFTYMIMMFCAGATEIAMAQWASLFVQEALGVSKVIGDLTGPCSFALSMAIGRIWFAAFSNKLNFRKTLIVLSSLCFVCYIVVAVCGIPALSLICCAICGFTVSISWPGIYSAGAVEFPNGGSVMYSTFAMCGDTGCAMGPWVLGVVADRLGLKFGFGVASVFAIVMIISTFSLHKKLEK